MDYRPRFPFVLFAACALLLLMPACHHLEQRTRPLRIPTAPSPPASPCTLLQDAEFGPPSGEPWTFYPGPFPAVGWRNPVGLDPLLGDAPLRVRWFDSELREVTDAQRPGRYLVYAETHTVTGAPVRRAATFYCAPTNWTPFPETSRIDVPYINHPHISPDLWREQAAVIGDMAGNIVLDGFFMRQEGAVLLAGLSEQSPLGRPATQLDSPFVRDQDLHLRLKLQLLGLSGKWPALQSPRPVEGPPAPVLRPGTALEAGMAADAVERIRAACQRWFDADGIPFNVCVARHGIVFFNEAFGRINGQPAEVHTTFETASTTKAFTGLLLAQFIEQGVIQLDDPIGKFLPDFPTTGSHVLTIRHCMTHTSGFSGHGNWGGMANPWLDNVLANGLADLQPGQRVHYDGMGPDLVGKVLEVVSGKSVFRLMHEHLYQPLGFGPATTQRDMAYGLACSAQDLARAGQLLLNQGAYGDQRFFSPAVLDSLMPCAIQKAVPTIVNPAWQDGTDWHYGIGLMWLNPLNVTAANPASTPADQIHFSLRTFGRGGMTGSQMQVDPDHDLVFAISRPRMDHRYFENFAAWMHAVELAMP